MRSNFFKIIRIILLAIILFISAHIFLTFYDLKHSDFSKIENQNSINLPSVQKKGIHCRKNYGNKQISRSCLNLKPQCVGKPKVLVGIGFQKKKKKKRPKNGNSIPIGMK